MIIVYDTNFLSSLLKINRLEMVKVLFKEENLYIPAAVLGEITKTDLITNLLNLKGKEYSEFSEEDCVIVAVAHDEFMESIRRGFEEAEKGETVKCENESEMDKLFKSL